MVTLSITKTYLDGSILTEAMLNNIKNDVESWANGNIDSTNINFLGSIVFRTSGNDSLDFNDSTDTLSLVVDGTTVLSIVEAAASVTIKTNVSNADMIFNVNDGGVDTTVITVTGSTGNITIAKNLTVTGTTTLTGNASLDGTGIQKVAGSLELLGTFNYAGASAAGTDTYAVSFTNAPSAYAAGQIFLFKADVANTGAATLNVNSLGAKTIKKNDGATLADLANNDILANQFVLVVYDGTNMELVGAPSKQLASKVDVITSTSTWTKPTNVTNVVVEAWGGGGGSGGGSTAGGGGGGGAGGYSTESVAVTANVSVTIGAAGAAGGANGDGGAGGATSFGSDLTANGGAGGLSGDNGGTGGAGGTATGGNINITGETGKTRTGSGVGSDGGNGGRAVKLLGFEGVGATSDGSNGVAATGYGNGGGAGAYGAGNTSGAVGTAGLVLVYYTT